MEGLQQLSFEMLSNVGLAKDCFVKAMQVARVGKFDEATDLIKEGEGHFIEGHRAHMQMIQSTQGEETAINLLIAHAEDQLMATDTIKIVTKEMIEVYKLIHNK
ncbi:MAG: PTS lactose/cellobiose transporter subunit IIA [Erysipelothrix sp.]|nr:PTS lactose/cellobiose transporter subunit IIA [Erysipelothrix sp.]